MFAETPACSEEENTISSFIFTTATCLQNMLHGCGSLNVLHFSSFHITKFYNTRCLKLLSITQVLIKSIEQMQLSQLHVQTWTADLHQLRLCGPECSSFIWRQMDSQAIQPVTGQTSPDLKGRPVEHTAQGSASVLHTSHISLRRYQEHYRNVTRLWSKDVQFTGSESQHPTKDRAERWVQELQLVLSCDIRSISATKQQQLSCFWVTSFIVCLFNIKIVGIKSIASLQACIPYKLIIEQPRNFFSPTQTRTVACDVHPSGLENKVSPQISESFTLHDNKPQQSQGTVEEQPETDYLGSHYVTIIRKGGTCVTPGQFKEL